MLEVTTLKKQYKLIIFLGAYWNYPDNAKKSFKELTLKQKSTARAVLFCLEMKRTCGAWKMKQGFALWSEPSAHGEVSVRFASRRQRRRFIEAARLLLHIREANASLTKLWIHAILYSKDGDIMASDKLSEQSMDFAVQIINLVKQLKEQRESIISNQIGRSGTSVGANIREAKYAHGTAEILFPKCRSRSKRQTKRVIGWSCFIKLIILGKNNITFLNQSVNLWGLCLFLQSTPLKIITNNFQIFIWTSHFLSV